MTTFTEVAKNTTTFTVTPAVGGLSYLLTDVPDFILVGSAEDETLILWDNTSFTSPTRNTTTFTAVTRN